MIDLFVNCMTSHTKPLGKHKLALAPSNDYPNPHTKVTNTKVMDLGVGHVYEQQQSGSLGPARRAAYQRNGHLVSRRQGNIPVAMTTGVNRPDNGRVRPLANDRYLSPASRLNARGKGLSR